MNPSATGAAPHGAHIGLDRVDVGRDDNIKATSQGPNDGREHRRSDSLDSSDDEQHADGMRNGKPSKRAALASKTKKILHIGNHSTSSNGNSVNSAPILGEAPEVHSDERYVHDLPAPEKIKLKDVIHDPVEAVKTKASAIGGHQAAANVAAKEIPHGREVELVQADDRLQQARTRKEKWMAINDIQQLLKERQDMFVRWTLDRHVDKVRVLPRNTVPFRTKKDFMVKLPNGKTKMDWDGYAIHTMKYYADQYAGEYVGEGVDPPKPSKENMAPNIERLLVATAPIQTLVMSARRISRWEDTSETSGYLAAYAILWMFDLVLPGMLAGMIFLILQRRFHAPTIETLRKDIQRTEDRNETALTVTEFIGKEGDQTWVEPLIEQIGPLIMGQLADLANLMEVIRNFYEWRVPSRTGISLAILTLGLVATIFTPLWLLVKITTLSLGFAFFGLFPIASRFPEYRLLASPVRWVFWKIPTHGEWAIRYLQTQGHARGPYKPTAAKLKELAQKRTSQQAQEPDPLGYRGAPTTTDGKPILPPVRQNSAPPVPPKDLGVYSCHGGSLTISSVGVRFEHGGLKSDAWSLNFGDIKRVEKSARLLSKAVGQRKSGDDLKLVGPDGVEHLLRSVEKRDEAFAQILGYSPAEWQIVW